MRVIVVGLGKSGTTALVYAIRSAMPAGTQLLFEPHSCVVLEAPDVAAKVLLHPKFPIDPAFYRQFDRIVLLLRDPRDLVISKALYRIYGGNPLHADLPKLGQYVDLLRAKEKDPRSVPFMRIVALFQHLNGRAPNPDMGIARRLNDIVQFQRAFPGSFVYTYEAMVAKQFEPVAQFLSLPAQAMNPEVPAGLQRVVRSRRAGNWRDWFCPEDVDHYRPLFAPYMKRYGYADRLDAEQRAADSGGGRERVRAEARSRAPRRTFPGRSVIRTRSHSSIQARLVSARKAVHRMFISHNTRSIFIHIQKTAGDAIETAVRKDDPALEVDRFGGRRHLFARDLAAVVAPEIWTAYFRFAFVRNPWDRLVSWYCMCLQTANNPFSKYVRDNAPTFADFITRTTTGMGERTTYNQLDFLVGSNGDSLVDFVGRYENLADGYAVVKKRLGLSHDLPHTNASSHTGYRDYYTTATRAIVADRFARDIAHFKYAF